MIVQGFAGPGGWCTGLRMAGYDGPAVGVELDRDACRTGVAAGHWRVQADVAAFPLARLAGKVTGVILSPPCPTWSTAGDGAGKVDMPNVYRLIADFAASRTPGDYEWADARSRLTAEPMRWAVALRPRWIALEQVPPVLPLWRYTAELLRKLGYRTWTGVLSAEEYGVPQTRKRAILMASLDGPVGPPPPTHQPYQAGRDPQVEPDLFGGLLPPPVSMAQALGWDRDELIGFPRLADNASSKTAAVVELDGVDYRARDLRSAEAPAQALTEKVRSWERYTLRGGPQDNATSRTGDEPAPTVMCSRPGNLQRQLRNGTQDNACVRDLDEPAGTMFFGQRGNTVRVTVQEAGILQSFPADYPWWGTKTAQYRQVGDAVPPALAAAILRPLLAAASSGQRAA